MGVMATVRERVAVSAWKNVERNGNEIKHELNPGSRPGKEL